MIKSNFLKSNYFPLLNQNLYACIINKQIPFFEICLYFNFLFQIVDFVNHKLNSLKLYIFKLILKLFFKEKGLLYHFKYILSFNSLDMYQIYDTLNIFSQFIDK